MNHRYTPSRQSRGPLWSSPRPRRRLIGQALSRTNLFRLAPKGGPTSHMYKDIRTGTPTLDDALIGVPYVQRNTPRLRHGGQSHGNRCRVT